VNAARSNAHPGTLIVYGYGPGISHATAMRFGREGYSLALVGRNEQRLADGVALLAGHGLDAQSYVSDAADPADIRRTVAEIRRRQGNLSAVVWTAFRNGGVTNVLQTRPEDVERAFDIGVTGLLACVQAAFDDLTAARSAAILVANGAVGENTSQADGFATMLGIDGVALENAAKSKLVGMLAERLREFDVYVGEVTVAGSVAGTTTARGDAIDPADIAELFWSLTRTRDRTRVRVVQ
jgi:NAD(P)-dependent dehydrogenase (short-subunit alcohol dehydrogenase family)